ncbi:MAG: BamA/TamA family outer membrane protein [Acidobacteriota bacterium]
MKYLPAAALLALAPLLAVAQEIDGNVNERYTVESVEVTGVDQTKLNREVRDSLHEFTGKKFSQAKLDELADLIRHALPNRAISVKISRGDRPDTVKITFEVAQREQRFDLAAPKAIYSSRQGFSGEVDATVRIRTNSFTVGAVSDGDSLVERFTGMRARYENRKVGSDRVRLAFEFDDFHTLWNGATREFIDGTPELYRARQNFEPAVTVVAARPLKLTFGMSFQRLQSQFPAAHTESSNAVISTLRYDRVLEESGPNKRRVEAGYSLRAATRSLGSDYAYTRHTFEFHYALWRGAHRLSERVTSGVIDGTAPLFDRFVLGNSTTLRGWNKYDIAPAGANRAVHNSLEYRYRAFEVFYDAGSVWNPGQAVVARHSTGAGLHLGDLALLIAFPLRSGRVEPVFIAGLNL